MEPAVDVIHTDRAYTSAVRIKEGGGRAPRYWLPRHAARRAGERPLRPGPSPGPRAPLAIVRGCDHEPHRPAVNGLLR
jgi:hypothetical protein